jgi:hypothetical protein
MSQRQVRIGGVLRCCMASVGEYEGPEVPGETVIGCKYHKDQNEPVMRLAADGIWEWVGSPDEGNKVG